ncbi:Retrovirus-related Pol polyprotein from transposon TNT 1-94 [Bienertia sinuspersici]
MVLEPASNQNNTIDFTSPLYLHPSEASTPICVDKLEGASSYRAWRRAFEISLALKRKLGFVTAVVTKETGDKVKSKLWDTCNNLVISWILATLSDPIKKSIMLMSNARSIWKHLEQRFMMTNGSRKYQLNKAMYDTIQRERSVSEYYTDMRILWEELESLTIYPPIIAITNEVTAFIQAMQQH